MKRRIATPIIIGIFACSVLSGLGLWQLQRLSWKEGLLSQISARLSTEPVAFPEQPAEEDDQFLQVLLDGRMKSDELHVLTSRRPYGPGFKVISAFELSDGRRILVDRGFVPEQLKDPSSRRFNLPAGMEVSGTLFWPNETDSFTPEPDMENNIWFARDLDLMAQTLGTRPLLVSLSAPATGEWPIPAPVAHNVPNNHLSYAVTWFALSTIWAGMTIIWVRAEIIRDKRLEAEKRGRAA
ncbi:MAG: SURF1 family protein [Pseudomonadota bacterium]